jgi:hypothetical protein
LANISLQKTIRIAYAAERCIQALLEKDDAWAVRTSKKHGTFELSEWLPQMMALHHPAASQLKPEAFLQLQGHIQLGRRQPKTRYTDLLISHFILGYTTLSHLKKTKNGKQVKEPFDRFFSVNRAGCPPITLSNGVRTDGDAIKSLRQRVQGYGHFAYKFDMEQTIALLPTLLLELAVHHLTSVQISELPSPTKIPFATLMHMPPIFESGGSVPFQDTNTPFGLCHLDKMMSPDFLSSGRWMGYYSDQRWALGRRHFDPPMRDIRILARTATKDDDSSLRNHTVIDSQSRGIDAVGEFSLHGIVLDDGFIQMNKTYLSNNFSWTWKARMTPFGIVGVWGDEERFGGYFWIWKEEWR